MATLYRPQDCQMVALYKPQNCQMAALHTHHDFKKVQLAMIWQQFFIILHNNGLSCVYFAIKL